MHFVSIHACELGSAGKGDQILWHETIEKIEGIGGKKKECRHNRGSVSSDLCCSYYHHISLLGNRKFVFLYVTYTIAGVHSLTQIPTSIGPNDTP